MFKLVFLTEQFVVSRCQDILEVDGNALVLGMLPDEGNGALDDLVDGDGLVIVGRPAAELLQVADDLLAAVGLLVDDFQILAKSRNLSAAR